MQVFVNSKQYLLPQSVTYLADALTNFGITEPIGIAIAINNTVIPKTEWQQYLLQADDKIMIIKATQGG